VGHVARAIVGGGFAVCRGKSQLPCCGPDDASGDAKEGGFAGTVATGEDDTFAGRNFQGDAAKGEETAVALIDVVEAEAGWSWRGQSVFSVWGSAQEFDRAEPEGKQVPRFARNDKILPRCRLQLRAAQLYERRERGPPRKAVPTKTSKPKACPHKTRWGTRRLHDLRTPLGMTVDHSSGRADRLGRRSLQKQENQDPPSQNEVGHPETQDGGIKPPLQVHLKSAFDQVAKELVESGFFAGVVFFGNCAGLAAKLQAKNLFFE